MWNPLISLLMMLFCVLARACHIFPLTFLCNTCRKPGKKIPKKMQIVLWFVGLRGAIAFALAENMPGPNKDSYVANTLCICIFTTVICGGFTERILTRFGMKQDDDAPEEEAAYEHLVATSSPTNSMVVGRTRQGSMSDRMHHGALGFWKRADDKYFKPLFGGSGVEGNATRSAAFEAEHGGGSRATRDDIEGHQEMSPSSGWLTSGVDTAIGGGADDDHSGERYSPPPEDEGEREGGVRGESRRGSRNELGRDLGF